MGQHAGCSSQGEILRPGWLLGAAAPSTAARPPSTTANSPDDNLELEIEGLGILQNAIGPKADGVLDPKRRRPGGHQLQSTEEPPPAAGFQPQVAKILCPPRGGAAR